MSHGVAVIGSGHGGAEAAAALRQAGYAEPIALVTEDPRPPYQRPPLSKAYLTGDVAFERILFKSPTFWEDKAIDLVLGQRVIAIDRDARHIVLEDGATRLYDQLVLATGARPRTLSCAGAELAGVYVLRSEADSSAIRQQLESTDVEHVVIVGGGYIGLEIAAAAKKRGIRTTILEAAPRLLARTAEAETASFFNRLHTAQGVDIRTEACVTEIVGETKVEAVRLANGDLISCHAVIVGIGVIANTELASGAELACDDGVAAGADCRTNDPNIFAIGDCASRFSPLYGRRLRLESVPSALEQARITAAVIAGAAAVDEAAPWFWSDQYDIKFQSVGLTAGFDAREIVGDPTDNRFAVRYYQDGGLICVDAVNMPAEFMKGKKAVKETLMQRAQNSSQAAS